MNDHIIRLLLVTIIVFLINTPFGYWRAGVKKFSFLWFLFIHLPVPMVILLRIYSHIGFAFYTYPLLVGAFFSGQFTGKKYIYAWVKNKQLGEKEDSY